MLWLLVDGLSCRKEAGLWGATSESVSCAITEIVAAHRYQMQDWDGKNLGEAMALRHKMPSFLPIQNQFRDWGAKVNIAVL